ncbi:hypothetical protein KBZ18_05210 [Synechococcus sp. Cruz-9H2]|uniref:hypothetical protein n=1 Tax=unclassified Synechococcus TaxID=2626047 RepID=UPI0020CBE04A|nr:MULTISPECIES: hypothetical protein [unclassified Synechococcus]MCP9818887.1 hypothetical protein [Synechococcus sp. Cruz-9H2]MCP9843390.1 hypothetical protein [Synechococcus sp. Edmonson 11F2]MCP9855227.1 hypothetical protein [Synechococcus sp. Cruz-9C9]MCP9862800.1 hypothetical protein [Synechococcus sp. Cruz-7E5]MCP9869797.1 hypothetical protein [Synechococcus sp. Cruz-7B9]
MIPSTPARLTHALAVLTIGVMAGGPSLAQPTPTCTFLMPIGGSEPVVSKRIGRGRLLGRNNWNTDFIVDQPFTSYRFFFTATSTDQASYPVQGFMRFTDGTSLQLFNETITPPQGTGRMWGPFASVPGKRTSQMNFRIGSSSQPGAVGFSYRISVQGCN